jgi:hypothetical protein
MKKNILAVVALFSMSIFITSCKKDTPSNTNNNPSSGFPRLAKYIELDTTQSAPYDTASIFYFTYDNSGRLTGGLQVYFGSVHDSVEVDLSQNFYQGADTLPYKSYGLDRDLTTPAIDYDTALVYYDANGRSIRDSIRETYIDESSSTTTNYISSDRWAFSGSQVSWLNYNYIPYSSYPNTDTVTQIISNGNIITQNDIAWGGGQNYTFSFDTHPNPFYYMGAGVTAIYNIAHDESVMNDPQKNNYTRLQESNSGTDFRNTYTYLSNGWPSTVVFYDWSTGSGIFQYKGIYIYK